MTDHPELFPDHHYPETPGYMKGSKTSKAAAESMFSEAHTLRAKVYNLIRNSLYGATCDEVEILLDLRHQTASARITELRRMGRIKANGTRPTRSGRKADVMVSI